MIARVDRGRTIKVIAYTMQLNIYSLVHSEIVLGLDVVRIRCIQASDKASKRCDADTLVYAEDGCKGKYFSVGISENGKHDIHVSILMCVAPASSAVYALAMAIPLSL